MNPSTIEKSVHYETHSEGCQTATEMSVLPQNSTMIEGPSSTQPRVNRSKFFSMKQEKSMVDLTARESVVPVAMVTILFVFWGCAYGFLDGLNSQFQQIAHITPGQSTALHSAYYGGYLVAPLTFGRLILKNWGFKACFITGLCLYGCGTLIFWPSAVLTSFPAFLLSNFVVGMGLSILEVSANPFSALCGPPAYMEFRLNLSQGVQAIATVLSGLLSSKVLFKPGRHVSVNSLLDTQWMYLGIALFVFTLAVAYYYLPLPEASDEDLARVAQRPDMANQARIKGKRVVWITAALGIFSQFCYVGAQEAVGTSFTTFVATDVSKTINTTNFLAAAHAAFAIARFAGAFLNLYFKPRLVLLALYSGVVIISICAMDFTGTGLKAMIVILFFCEGPIFPIIYAMCLRGMGSRTKDVSALMTASISGGAIIPVIQTAVSGGKPDQYAYSFCVVASTFIFGMLLPIYCNLVPAARKQVDPVKQQNILLQHNSAVELISSQATERRSSSPSEGREKK